MIDEQEKLRRIFVGFVHIPIKHSLLIGFSIRLQTILISV